MAPRSLSPSFWTLAALAFCLVATLNAGGYRFGVADQAFYLPALQRHVDPDSFPRDRVVIDDQDRLNVLTSVLAAGVRSTGLSREVVFAGIYVISLVVLAVGAGAVARAFGASSWAVVGVLAALTLRHRVGITGVNTLESYGHPRMLAFAAGVCAVAALLRGRMWPAFALVGLAFVIHPTTALWMGVWVGLAALTTEPRARPWLAGGAVGAAAAAAWTVTAGPLAGQMVVMDPEWRGVIGAKDYLFPNAWPASGWLLAAVYVAAVAWPYVRRRRQGALVHGESGVVAGLAGLLTLFLLSVPATAAGLALAVQLQVSRIFWMFDLIGTLYVVMLIVDSAPPARRRQYAAMVLVAIALARGVYVKWVEHPERPVASATLARSDWQDAMAWLARTPVATHVLAHPGHAWKYGTSVRVAAGRDVLLEEVKDTAMSMYSRRVAMRVLERIRATEHFDGLTADDARALAARYRIDYLVDERPFDLPVAYRAGRFTVYRVD